MRISMIELNQVFIAVLLLSATILFTLLLIYRQLRLILEKSSSAEDQKLLLESSSRNDSKVENLQEGLSEVRGIIDSLEIRQNSLFNDLRKELRDNDSSSRIESNKSRHAMVDSILTQLGYNRNEMCTSLERFERCFASQLEEMRKTVDEKLQTTLEKRISESFRRVSDRLEQVHKGLGEMQVLASGVGDLKKVLSNVKTRGIIGEYQLGNILEQLLTAEQYGVNVVTKTGSFQFVEYAIKMPGNGIEDTVWLPIDSKFPMENYERLVLALEEGNTKLVEETEKALIKDIETSARDISTKYIDPPNTTDFAILFLPIESLYCEVLRHCGLFDKLQTKYHITVTGPTTLSALLNSLQMGFRTLAVQKRSSEVWKVLSTVQAEFGKFAEHLDKVQNQLNAASANLENLRTTRTSQVQKKLSSLDYKLL
jgi:DNA recombination protein RmuC